MEIYQSLSAKELDGVLNHFEKATDKIFENDRRGRTRDHIFKSVKKGFLGELAVATLLHKAGLRVIWTTLLWKERPDLMIDDVGFEVKTFNSGHNYLSYTGEHSDKQSEGLRINPNFNYLIAVKLFKNEDETNNIYRPWMIVKSKAFLPSSELFVKKTGWYLQDIFAAQRGMCIRFF